MEFADTRAIGAIDMFGAIRIGAGDKKSTASLHLCPSPDLVDFYGFSNIYSFWVTTCC